MKSKIFKFIILDFVFILTLVLFYNLSFFNKTANEYSVHGGINFLSWLNLFFMLFFSQVFLVKLILLPFDLVSIVSKKRIISFVGYFLIFIVSALVAYGMDQFGIVFDQIMILNVLHTNASEVFDLYTHKLLLYVFPVLIIYGIFIFFSLKQEILTFKEFLVERVALIFSLIAIIFILILSNSSFYASFFREHKPLRYYSNPSYWIYNGVYFVLDSAKNRQHDYIKIGTDAKIDQSKNKKKLIVFVVGETARADHFSLNGYNKKTNPRLEKINNIYSFKNVTSCGTSTAVSVPCMFSHYGKENFNVDIARNTDNLLDVLAYTNDVELLWRDNNSDSKGVANRIKYEDFKFNNLNPICENGECRDVGMLSKLDLVIKETTKNNVLIVLHMMGNHGPAYYKRYPSKFEIFKPTCKTSLLEKCSNEEISNAYDNAILYTDYFLSEVISLLKKFENNYHTMMFYVSDHGESLGENGIYLHSLPYALAPKAQIHVPMIWWLSDSFQANLKPDWFSHFENKELSHDYIFHTMLGLFNVSSSVKNPEKDITFDLKN